MIENSPSIDDAVRTIYGEAVSIVSRSPVSGGCINRASKLDLSNGVSCFMKENRSSLTGMFKAEADGLLALLKEDGPIVPEPLAVGSDGGNQFILMSYIPQGRPSIDYWEEFGRSFARLHKHRCADYFGFEHDNYIGSTPQKNTPCKDWIEFFGTEHSGQARPILLHETGFAVGEVELGRTVDATARNRIMRHNGDCFSVNGSDGVSDGWAVFNHLRFPAH